MADIRDTDIPVMSREAAVARAPLVKSFVFPNISWSAIFAGISAGVATHLLLMLFGAAAGLSAVDLQSSQPVGAVPLAVGIWNGISMLISAFIGGYVAARSSGMSRRADGLLHGFVSWGATTLLFAYLATTAVGNVVGGAFSALGGGLSTAAQAGAAASQGESGQGGLMSQMQSIISGGEEGVNIDTQSLGALQESLRAGDRAAATNILVNDMGLSPERAEQVVNRLAPLVSGPGGGRIAQATDQTVQAAAVGSWSLSIAILLSLALGLVGGALGARSLAHRRVMRTHAITA